MMIELLVSLRGTWPEFRALAQPHNQGVLAFLLLFSIVVGLIAAVVIGTMPPDHH